MDRRGPTTKAWESRQEGAWKEAPPEKLRALVRFRTAGTLCRENPAVVGRKGGAVADMDARRMGRGRDAALPACQEYPSQPHCAWVQMH